MRQLVGVGNNFGVSIENRDSILGTEKK